MTELNKLLDFYHANIREAVFQIAPTGITPGDFGEVCIATAVGFASTLGLTKERIEFVFQESVKVLESDARADIARQAFRIVGADETAPHDPGNKLQGYNPEPPKAVTVNPQDVTLMKALLGAMPEELPFVVVYIRDEALQTAARLKSLRDQVNVGQACITAGQRILQAVRNAQEEAGRGAEADALKPSER